jgi:hypothetical protein
MAVGKTGHRRKRRPLQRPEPSARRYFRLTCRVCASEGVTPYTTSETMQFALRHRCPECGATATNVRELRVIKWGDLDADEKRWMRGT